jgi:hypothetical protein
MRQIIGEIFNEGMLLSLNFESGDQGDRSLIFFLREEKAGAKAASFLFGLGRAITITGTGP